MSIAFIDKIADSVAAILCRPWSPIDQRVWITVDDPRDAALESVTLYGCIRASSAPNGELTDLLVELERPCTFGSSHA